MSESMIERVARTLETQAWAALGTGDTIAYKNRRTSSLRKARAAIEAMKDPPFDILGAMFEAMFEDKWNASQAPMIGAGWDAGIDAALTEHANAR